MGTGAIDSPLTLSEAMSHEGILPGHTVWLRGGLYNAQSSLTCTLQGTAENYITVQNYPGELVQIDAELLMSCPYTRWMSTDYNLEIVGTDTDRTTAGHYGIQHAAAGVELINIRIINVKNTGMYFFGYPGLVYGCHIIHNGYIGDVRIHGPGIYSHNNTGSEKDIINCAIVDSFRYGLQLYSDSTNHVWNYDVIDTTVIGPDIIVSGAPGADYPSLDDVLLDRLSLYGGRVFIGLYQGARGDRLSLINSNIRHTWQFSAYKMDRLTIESCNFFNELYDFVECEADLSTCVFSPSGVNVNIVPNLYAPNFATLTVFNWDYTANINIDISTFMESGTVRVHNIILMRSEYRDIEVSAGVLALGMTGWTTPPPLGLETPTTNAYPVDFGCWILEKLD